MSSAVVLAAAALAAGGAAWLDPVLAALAAPVPAGALQPAGAPSRPAPAGPGPAGRERIRRIPHRRVVVVVVAALAGAAVAARTGAVPLLPAQVALVAALVPLGACDAEWLLLPRRPVWGTLATAALLAAAATAATGDWHRLAVAALAGAVAFAGFAALSCANPEWMGFGDVRLAAPVAFVLGWSGGWREALAGLLLVNLLAGTAGVVLLLTGRASRGSALPYGVFIAAGTVATLLLCR